MTPSFTLVLLRQKQSTNVYNIQCHVTYFMFQEQKGRDWLFLYPTFVRVTLVPLLTEHSYYRFKSLPLLERILEVLSVFIPKSSRILVLLVLSSYEGGMERGLNNNKIFDVPKQGGNIRRLILYGLSFWCNCGK